MTSNAERPSPKPGDKLWFPILFPDGSIQASTAFFVAAGHGPAADTSDSGVYRVALFVPTRAGKRRVTFSILRCLTYPVCDAIDEDTFLISVGEPNESATVDKWPTPDTVRVSEHVIDTDMAKPPARSSFDPPPSSTSLNLPNTLLPSSAAALPPTSSPLMAVRHITLFHLLFTDSTEYLSLLFCLARLSFSASCPFLLLCFTTCLLPFNLFPFFSAFSLSSAMSLGLPSPLVHRFALCSRFVYCFFLTCLARCFSTRLLHGSPQGDHFLSLVWSFCCIML